VTQDCSSSSATPFRSPLRLGEFWKIQRHEYGTRTPQQAARFDLEEIIGRHLAPCKTVMRTNSVQSHEE
jgi:hypothetical protein